MRRLLALLTLAAPGLARAAQPLEATLAAAEVNVASSYILDWDGISTDGHVTQPDMLDVRASLGPYIPVTGQGAWTALVGPTFAILSTGDTTNITALHDFDYPQHSSNGGLDPDDTAAAHLRFVPPPGANSLALYFAFLSREYPEWVGSNFNDRFHIDVDGPAWTGQVAVDSAGNEVSVNTAWFDVVDPVVLAGTGFDVDGATMWLRAFFPVAPGQEMTVNLNISDMADGVWDSAVLLDGFLFSNVQLTAPYIHRVEPRTGELLDGTSFGGQWIDWSGALVDHPVSGEPASPPLRPEQIAQLPPDGPDGGEETALPPREPDPPGVDLSEFSPVAGPPAAVEQPDAGDPPAAEPEAQEEAGAPEQLVLSRACSTGGSGGLLLLPLLLGARRRR